MRKAQHNNQPKPKDKIIRPNTFRVNWNAIATVTSYKTTVAL
jgi:hypothetical protein